MLFHAADAGLGSLAGLASHAFLFIHGEWHVHAPLVFNCYLALLSAVFICNIIHFESYALSAKATIVFSSSYACGVLVSIGVYRYFFHQLRSFPGPPLARISKFWHVWKCRDSKNYLVLQTLEKRYGSFVRTGPSELTVFLPDVLPAIDGPGSPCDKAVWYDLLLPEMAVNTTRDRGLHDKRRRIWDRSFTSRALDEYEKRVHEYAGRLERCIARCSARSEAVDVSVWFYWFTFDVMGEFAFGKSFNMLEDEKWHFAVIMLRRAMRLLGPLSPVPWLAQIGIMNFPWLWVIRDWLSMLDWCRDRMRERMQSCPKRADVSQWLIEPSQKGGTIEQDLPWLYGDAVTIIIAGSDTLAPTLVYIFYELALEHKRAALIREELKNVDIRKHRALEACRYLNGVINETLRLHPPVPTHGYRQTPPEGIMVAGTFIPGGTTIVAPRYSFGRSERCYQEPESFIPERWFDRPELVRDKRAFKPFGQGRYGCVGQQLALRELRFVTALLIQRYNVRLAPGEDGTTVWKEMRDYFTAAPGSLKLSFESVGNMAA